MDPQRIAEFGLIPFIIVFGIVAIVARQRRRLHLGLGIRHAALAQFPLGLAIGIVAILAIFGSIAALGGLRIDGAGWDGSGLLAILLYLIVLGVVEEAAFRGLLMNGLRVTLRNTWAAVGATAVLVGVPYFFAEGANALSIVSGVLSGVMYGTAFVLTGRIWLGSGLRVAWNFVQGPLLGFPVSGTVLLQNSVIRLEPVGNSWLTGGPYGPEASIPGLVVRMVIIIMLIMLIMRRSPRTTEPLPLKPPDRSPIV